MQAKVTMRKIIREMDAQELVEHLKMLHSKGDSRTPEDFVEQQECNEQFYQLTGDLFPSLNVN